MVHTDMGASVAQAFGFDFQQMDMSMSVGIEDSVEEILDHLAGEGGGYQEHRGGYWSRGSGELPW